MGIDEGRFDIIFLHFESIALADAWRMFQRKARTVL